MNDETTTVAENTNDAPAADQPAANPAAQSAGQESRPQTDKPATGMPETLLNTATETKPEEKQDGEKAPKDSEADKPAEGAPEKYEEFKAPEGTMLDAAVMQQFGEVAKELNLPQDKAQDVVNKMAPIMVQRQMEQIAGISKQWAEKSSMIRKLPTTSMTLPASEICSARAVTGISIRILRSSSTPLPATIQAC